MAPVTPKALIKHLMSKYPEGTSQEDVARTLGIPLRDFSRWASIDDPAKGPSWRYTLKLLDAAGWLNLGAEAVQRTSRALAPVPADTHEDLVVLRESLGVAVEKILQGQQTAAAKIGDRQRELLAAIESLRSHLDDLPASGRSFPRRRQGNASGR